MRKLFPFSVTLCALLGCTWPRAAPSELEHPHRGSTRGETASPPLIEVQAETDRKPDDRNSASDATTTSSASHPLVDAARRQIGVTVAYDPAYVGLKYPNGDVPSDRGVCTDVVIRALRAAHGYDLQAKVHEDMKAAFSAYPTTWGAKRPDRNIDHRRVLNLERFFEREGWSVPITNQPEDYLPGDIVACVVGGRLPHIMVVSDRRSPKGVPLVIHNIGAGTQEEDLLFTYPHTGHYRPKLRRSSAGQE